MAETFVPLPRPAASAKETAFTPLTLKSLLQPNNQPASPEACPPPVLTLQRDGDKITAIHIECSCGQVIDLGCEY